MHREPVSIPEGIPLRHRDCPCRWHSQGYQVWIIALKESLVQENPNKIIRAFVDAFKEKYGVECVAALHHNKSKTNYHIHLIFADRKLYVTVMAD